MMHHFKSANAQWAKLRHNTSRRLISHYALAALLALGAVPTSHAALCGLDVDGNGRLEGTTDGLLMMRYMLGIRGTALVSGALGTGASRTLPADIEAHLGTPCTQPGWVGQGTGRLNDTGIIFGGEKLSGNNATCTSSTTGFGIGQQDCSNGRDANPSLNSAADGVLGFSFSKISNSGAVLPASALLDIGPTDWGCTYDNVTGLMWEVKTATGRRSVADTYTWFSSDASNNFGSTGTANGGTCFDAGQCDTEKFAQLINVAGLCGHNDWRLPHVKELESILHLGGNSPTIDGNWFPITAPGSFWSSSPAVINVLAAWLVSFSDGTAATNLRSTPRLVRLVRAGQ